MRRHSLTRTAPCRPVSLFLLALFLTCIGGHTVSAQTGAVKFDKCPGTLGSYQSAGYVVKAIRIRPLLKFMPGGAALDDALASSMAKLGPGRVGLSVGDAFNEVALSRLNDELSVEINDRLLTGQTGFLRVSPILRNCNGATTPPTLEVEYVVLTVARPSYLNSSYELRERKSKEKEEAGNTGTSAGRLSTKPYIGYNRSRAIYGGTAFSYAANAGPVQKIELDASGSGSSAVADASLSGSRQYDSGALSYAEWRLGYRYSNIPTDGVRLRDATGLAQFFGATRPFTGHNLFFRFGASLEAGNRQTDLAQAALPASELASSGYGSLKMYAGGTLNSKTQDWKASYGLELGNSGNGLSVDYIKQVFDTAYRLRLLPRPHMPLQIDARLTAGSLSTSSGGSIPVAERFFGGNVEHDFIQGDTWRIRANPFIRSFPQDSLNRGELGLPVGGSNFVALNLTIAPTLWSKQLMPREVSRDADLKAALGAQLLNTRKFLRETPIHKSEEIKRLAETIRNLDAAPAPPAPPVAAPPDAGPPLTVLKNLLGCPAPGSASDTPSNSLPEDAQELVSTLCGEVSDAETNVASAVLPPEDSTSVIENEDQVRQFLNNPVESQARTLAIGFPDPDPDVSVKASLTALRDDAQSLRAMLEGKLQSMSGSGSADTAAKLRAAISALSALSNKGAASKCDIDGNRMPDDGNGRLDNAQCDILSGITAVRNLRAYSTAELQPMLDVLNRPADGSGKTLDQLLDKIKEQLVPVRASAEAELKEVQDRIGALPAESSELKVMLEREKSLQEFLDLLDVPDTYADKAKSSHADANAFMEKQLTDETKYSIELLAVGFGGGSPAHLAGVVEGIAELRKPFAERNLTPQWNVLRADADALLFFQKRVAKDFGKVHIPASEQEANRTVFYVGGVLDVFFRQLNLIGVSPVFMFDAARLGASNGPGTGGFRYGIGSGVRFSLVNLDFTAGYSVNPNRRPHEGRGAFVFTMEINDLFR